MNSYYYLNAKNERRGPVDGNRLPAEGVTPQSLVWCVGMKEWTPAADVPELAVLFQPSVQPEPAAAQPDAAQGETHVAAEAQPAQPQYQQPQQQPQFQQPQPQYQQQPYQQPYQQPAYGQPYPYGYQQQAPMGSMPPMPDTNLVLAIISTICCCLPLGIVAIIYSSKVSGLYAAGQYQEALKASANAKKWAIWSIIAGIVFSVVYTIIMIAAGSAATFSSSIY